MVKQTAQGLLVGLPADEKVEKVEVPIETENAEEKPVRKPRKKKAE